MRFNQKQFGNLFLQTSFANVSWSKNGNYEISIFWNWNLNYIIQDLLDSKFLWGKADSIIWKSFYSVSKYIALVCDCAPADRCYYYWGVYFLRCVAAADGGWLPHTPPEGWVRANKILITFDTNFDHYLPRGTIIDGSQKCRIRAFCTIAKISGEIR